MKFLVIVCLPLLFCAFIPLSAQQSGGLKKLGYASSGTTRAVVVGISRYGEGIRSLQYAHKDATAFVEFLKSRAGGEVSKENIRILLNEEATLSAVDNALYWLRTSSEKGDQAILYFSGHGDVETDALWQFGYLLCSDSPPNNFRNNAVRVEDLDLLAIELSTVKEARTLFIIDACRSGTLSEGRQVPHTHLANQKANEVRILSCQSDQLSLEGAQWGGGRGVFSWHLLRGLKGLAHDPDLSEDPDAVTLEELNLFLRKQMRRSTQEMAPPQYQDPVVTGNERFRLARIDPDILAEAQAADLLKDTGGGAIGSRGGDTRADEEFSEAEMEMTPARFFGILKEIGWLDRVDLRPLLAQNPRQMPSAFLSFVQSRDSALMKASWTDREALMTLKPADLLKADKREGSNTFNLRLAVYLHDYGQELINRYLKVDKSEIGDRGFHTSEEAVFARHPAVFELALKLLPADHPLVPRIQVKHLYYQGVAIRIAATGQPGYAEALQKAMGFQEKALQLDDKSPYIHNELGILRLSTGDLEGALRHFQEAATLAPSWGLPYHNMSVILYRQQKKAEARSMTASALERSPQYFAIHLMQGKLQEEEGQLLRAEESYYRAHQLEPDHFLPHRHLGFFYLRTGEYSEAERQLVLFREKSRGVNKEELRDPMWTVVMAPERKMPLEPLPAMDMSKVFDPRVAWDYAIHQMQADALTEAEKGLKRVVELDPAFPNVWYQLSWLFARMRRWGESDYAMRIARERDGDAIPVLMLHADILENWGRYDAAIPLVEEVIRQMPDLTPAYDRLGRLYEKAGRPHAAEALYSRLRQVEASLGINRLYALYLDMRRRHPADEAWAFRMAEFLRPFSEAVVADLGVRYFSLPVEGPPEPSSFVPPLFDGKMEMIVSPFKERVRRELTTWPNICMYLDELLDVLGGMSLDTLQRVQVHDMKAGIRMKRHLWEEALAEIRPTLDDRTARVDGQDRLLEVFVEYPRPYEEKDVMAYQFGEGLLRYPDHLRLARARMLDGAFAEGEEMVRLAATVDLDRRHTEELAWIRARGAWMSGEFRLAAERLHALLDSRQGAQAAYTLARLQVRGGNEEEAWTWLEEALTKGFRYGEVLVHDPYMASLRSRPEWTALLKRQEVTLPE